MGGVCALERSVCIGEECVHWGGEGECIEEERRSVHISQKNAGH